MLVRASKPSPAERAPHPGDLFPSTGRHVVRTTRHPLFLASSLAYRRTVQAWLLLRNRRNLGLFFESCSYYWSVAPDGDCGPGCAFSFPLTPHRVAEASTIVQEAAEVPQVRLIPSLMTSPSCSRGNDDGTENCGSTAGALDGRFLKTFKSGCRGKH